MTTFQPDHKVVDEHLDAVPNPRRRDDAVVAPHVVPPSILGLYGFAVATFAVSANLAGWYGDARITPLVLFPFALVVGGLTQLIAAVWAYRANDALGTGMHGLWGSYWIAYGIYYFMISIGAVPQPVAPAASSAFGFWFITLAAVTAVGTIAATRQSMTLAATLGALTVGATLLGISLITLVPILQTIAAVVLVVSALFAFYTASALLLGDVFGRRVLPTGEWSVRHA